ncbi:MAG: chemotaxis protein CheR, partial [Peptococcaceae bacterium]|nr:chemotaxis protein CheR [Peptococcaceae bacterium]
MDFSLFRDRIYKDFKLNLNAYKENQLKRRLDGLMTKKGVKSGDYVGFHKMLTTDKQAFLDFLDTVTINVSEFFRDKSIFAVLEDKIIPQVASK